MEIKPLLDIGLTEREAKIFSVLLQGGATIGKIVSRTGIQHTKAYEALDRLIKKGLVYFSQEGRIKHFYAGDVDVLVTELEDKKDKLLEYISKTKRTYPEKEQIQIYKGFKAVKSCYNELFKHLGENGFYWVFAFRSEYLNEPIAKRFFRQVHLRLTDMKVDDRIIAPLEVKNAIKSTYRGVKGMKFIFTSMLLPEGLVIFPNGILHVIWGEEPIGILIFSEKLSKQYQNMFSEVWNLIRKKR